MMSENFQIIMNLVEKWEAGGIKQLKNGTLLVCHVPDVGSEAWLHEIYKGLSNDEITELEKKLSINLPNQYKEFLVSFNGLNLFLDNLSIWGLRSSYSRHGEDIYQPYDLVALNDLDEKPFGCPDNCLFFGSYSWDGTKLMFDLSEGFESNKVYLYEERSQKTVYEWENIWSYLESEVNRLSKLFSIDGTEIDENMPKSPIA